MNNGQTRLHSEDSNTEADARAKMWLWLNENGYLEDKDTKNLNEIAEGGSHGL